MNAFELQAVINLLQEAREIIPHSPDTEEWHQDCDSAVRDLQGKLKKEAA
jgi:hypothetical protein